MGRPATGGQVIAVALFVVFDGQFRVVAHAVRPRATVRAEISSSAATVAQLGHWPSRRRPRIFFMRPRARRVRARADGVPSGSGHDERGSAFMAGSIAEGLTLGGDRKNSVGRRTRKVGECAGAAGAGPAGAVRGMAKMNNLGKHLPAYPVFVGGRL